MPGPKLASTADEFGAGTDHKYVYGGVPPVTLMAILPSDLSWAEGAETVACALIAVEYISKLQVELTAYLVVAKVRISG